ncbi:MAG: EAL domain-containing protein [Nocardioidaceae bacterium]|nr:EAL domain-containing protein [Nocardioidaceae bacterium]
MNRRGRRAQEIRDALDGGELRVAYQPVVELHGGQLTGLEALLRWQHPDRGLMMPNEILPVAESTGLILGIGEWVLTQACRDLQQWRQLYGSAIPHVTVNVSPFRVMASGFQTTVERVLQMTRTDPADIFLEVTESTLLEDGPRANSVLQQIKDLGVGLILDDFGTGYSSLNYLRRFPFDLLKIDRAFTKSLESDESTRKIVAGTIDLAHVLELEVVVEGVETARQLTQVIDLGTDRAQGYYLCPPLPADQIKQRILETAAETGPIRFPLPERATGN